MVVVARVPGVCGMVNADSRTAAARAGTSWTADPRRRDTAVENPPEYDTWEMHRLLPLLQEGVQRQTFHDEPLQAIAVALRDLWPGIHVCAFEVGCEVRILNSAVALQHEILADRSPPPTVSGTS